MIEKNSTEIIQELVKARLAYWAYNQPLDYVFPLGKAFRDRVAYISTAIEKHRLNFEAYFEQMVDDERQAILNDELTPQSREALKELATSARKDLGTFSRMNLVALGVYPNDLADYDYWCQRDRFTQREFLWLTLGLEPSDYWDKALQSALEGTKTKLEPDESQSILRRYDLIRRATNLSFMKDVSVDRAYDWIEAIDLDVPPAFKEALGVAKKRLVPQDAEKANREDVGPTERQTLLKLIAAMSCEQYAFDPSALRSSTFSRIAEDLDAVGLSLDPKTIRRWVKQAAELVPEEYWKEGR